jgi:hypothetical protein
MERTTTRETGRPAGRSADVSREVRPGVPRQRSPSPDPGAHWERPEQQRGVPLLARAGLRAATPVFGTGQPARGLSGVLRRAAYRTSEYGSARWALLLLADRVDVLEHRGRSGLWLLPAAIAVGLGYAAVSRALER